MLALCARYQFRPVGLETNSSQSRTGGDDGSPGRSPTSATASHPSRSSRSLIARHQTLPGGDASSRSSTPRFACQRMNDSAARRNGRPGARPVGPRCPPEGGRAVPGSSRTAATCSRPRSAPSDGAFTGRESPIGRAPRGQAGLPVRAVASPRRRVPSRPEERPRDRPPPRRHRPHARRGRALRRRAPRRDRARDGGRPRRVAFALPLAPRAAARRGRARGAFGRLPPGPLSEASPRTAPSSLADEVNRKHLLHE